MTMLETATTSIGGVGRMPLSAPRPPRPMTQEERILAALGVLRGPLPRVSHLWLTRYFRHLASTLVFPFDACCPVDGGTLRPWTAGVAVVELLSPADNSGVGETGLLCRAAPAGAALIDVPLIDLEVPPEHANAELIEDYWYWFWNWRFDPGI